MMTRLKTRRVSGIYFILSVRLSVCPSIHPSDGERGLVHFFSFTSRKDGLWAKRRVAGEMEGRWEMGDGWTEREEGHEAEAEAEAVRQGFLIGQDWTGLF